MNLFDRRELCHAADASLAQTPSHRRTALLWAGIAAAAGLLSNLVNFLLSTRIAETGGLDGMGMRGALSTLQTALTLFVSVALPFWNMGHSAAALEMSRSHKTHPGTLLEGFRRFGPVLRFLLLQGVLYIGLMLLAVNLNSFLIMLTPLSGPLMEAMLPVMDSASLSPDQAVLDALTSAMVPVMVCCAAVFLVLFIPVSYRLRMVPFLLMEDPQCGALYAMITSAKMMRHNCLALFLLDLRFWWFYLAEVLILVLSYGDMLLPLMGITLPIQPEVAYFLFYVLALVIQVGLYTLAKNRIQVTYAKAYDTLAPRG